MTGRSLARARAILALLLLVLAARPVTPQSPPDSITVLLQVGARALGEGTADALERALASSRRAVELLDAGDRPAERARAHLYIATAHFRLGHLDSSEANLDRARALAVTQESLVLQADIANQGGLVDEQRGDWRSALRRYRQADSLATLAGDEFRRTESLNNIAGIHYWRGDYDSAAVGYGRALDVARIVGDSGLIGALMTNLGSVLDELGQRDSALVLYRQSLAFRRQANDLLGVVVVLNNMASLFQDRGRVDSARVYYRRALVALEPLADTAERSNVLQNLATLERSVGRPAAALAALRTALQYAKVAGDREGVATVLANIGRVHDDLERPDSAIAYHRQSLEIARAIDSPRHEMRALNNIGAVFERARQPDSASAYLGAARALAVEHRDSLLEATILSNLGLVELAQGNRALALSHVRRAHSIYVATGDSSTLAVDLNNLGALHERAGERDSAESYYRSALSVARAVESFNSIRTALENLGTLHARGARADLPRALAYYDSAAAVIRRYRSETADDADLLTFAEGSARLYDEWALGWLARTDLPVRDRALAALAAAERGRAQALLDLLRRRAVDAQDTSLVRDGARLIEGTTTPVLSYLATRDTLLIWIAQPAGDVFVVRRAIMRDSLARLVAHLRDAMGADEARPIARQARFSDLDVVPRRQDGADRGGVAGPLARRDWTAAAALVSQWLLPPEILRRLPADGELVVVPHGPLGLVPFAALPVGDTMLLGDRRAVRYAPSIVILGLAERSRPAPSLRDSSRILIVGNPRMPVVPTADGGEDTLAALPGSEAEARAIARQLGSRALTGDSATESEVRPRIPTAAVVHLATHGYAYSAESHARESFVALGPDAQHDGRLTMGEVLDELPDLAADLVVVSACQSGLGNLKQAEGTVGLQRALIAKGARTVLVSLWSVDDQATRLLMERFYAHWGGDGDRPGKAEALRRAQADVRGMNRYAHPRYWAAFQLVGAS